MKWLLKLNILLGIFVVHTTSSCNHNSKMVIGDTLKLFISCGQSNMGARALKDYPYANLDKTVTGVNMWSWKGHNINTFQDFQYEWTNGSEEPGSPFWAGDIIVWKKVYDSIYEGREEVFAMKATLTGTSLAPDNPLGGSWCYPQDSVLPGKPRMLDTLKNRLNAIRAAYPNKYVKVVLAMWLQGESDAGNLKNESAYYYRQDRTIMRIREICNDPNLPIISGTVPYKSVKYSGIIDSVVKSRPNRDKNFYVVNLGDQPLKKDRLHIDNNGQRYFGDHAFTIIKTILK